MITGKPNWKAYLWPFDITCSANAYVTLVRDRHFPIWSCFPTMWIITIIFPRSDTQYLVLVQCLHYSQMAQRKSQMFWRNVSVALNAVERLHSTEVRRAVNRTCKFIVRQKKQRSAVECTFEESSRTEMGLSLKTNWNHKLPLFSMCLFYWQRIHFKRRLFNNQVVFIAPRITVSSNFSQSACTEITWVDPRQLIGSPLTSWSGEA